MDEVQAKISVLNVLFCALASREDFKTVDKQTFDYVITNLTRTVAEFILARPDDAKHCEQPA
jgi:hypothetical protein